MDDSTITARNHNLSSYLIASGKNNIGDNGLPPNNGSGSTSMSCFWGMGARTSLKHKKTHQNYRSGIPNWQSITDVLFLRQLLGHCLNWSRSTKNPIQNKTKKNCVNCNKIIKKSTLKGELCCWRLLNSSWCWAPVPYHLHPGTWSLPSPGCCCMPPTCVVQHSLSPLQKKKRRRKTEK